MTPEQNEENLRINIALTKHLPVYPDSPCRNPEAAGKAADAIRREVRADREKRYPEPVEPRVRK